MKVKTKKNLKKQCDIAWSKKVKELSHGRCEVCGSISTLNSHHIIGRVNYALRWDLKNGMTLCSSCHKFSKTSAHNDPVHFMEYFKKARPEDYQYLLTKKNTLAKYIDYEQILKELRGEI